MKKIILSLFLFISLISSSIKTVEAQTRNNFDPNFASTSSPMEGCGNESINTAIGCVPVGNTTVFMGWILGWAIGLGGGIAFLLIVYASFMIMTSQGVPDRLKAGQELLTSAISGLVMLIFSVFILKFIGIDILGIGEFGFGFSG